MCDPLMIRYANTPMNGTKMMKMIQRHFLPPPMSWRRKTSMATLMMSQNQMIQAKKTSIVPTTSRNG